MNSTKRKTRTGRRSGVGTGTTSLLMIFTVLCFATLAMLSLSTASSNQRIQQEGLDRAKAVAAAKGEVAVAVAELDAQLALLGEYSAVQLAGGEDLDTTLAGQEAAAQTMAESLGWEANPETGLVAMRLPIDESTELLTELRLLPAGSGGRYTVVRQITRLIDGWTPSDDGQLWGGETA